MVRWRGRHIFRCPGFNLCGIASVESGTLRGISSGNLQRVLGIGERSDLERRAASHTEEEEMNQRRRLLGLARKGDPKAISKLFELYQVRVLNGEMLSKLNKSYYKAAAAQEQKAQAATKSAKPQNAVHGSQKVSTASATPAGKSKAAKAKAPKKRTK